MKKKHTFHVHVGQVTATVEANNAGHAVALARPMFLRHALSKESLRRLTKAFKPDSTTGGWKGVSVEQPGQNVVRVPKPTPKPAPRDLPWKRAQAA